jgi:hypothetical protein
MPTFGGLLKKKKTKEEKEEKSSGYQPIQYKESHKKDTQTSSQSKPAASEVSNASQPANVTTVTSQPDPANDRTTSNGSPQKEAMNVANLANPAGGSVESKGNPRQTKGKYTLTDFALQRTLGTGSFGRVHLVQSKHNQRFYAIKVLKKAQVVKMKQIEHTNDERRMLQRVKHPFLITLWGTFQDSKNLYMVMDFIEGGELFSLLRKSQVSSPNPCLTLLLTANSASPTRSPNSMPPRSHWHWNIYMLRTSSIETSSRRTCSSTDTVMSKLPILALPKTCPILPGHCAARQTISLLRWSPQRAITSLLTGTARTQNPLLSELTPAGGLWASSFSKCCVASPPSGTVARPSRSTRTFSRAASSTLRTSITTHRTCLCSSSQPI